VRRGAAPKSPPPSARAKWKRNALRTRQVVDRRSAQVPRRTHSPCPLRTRRPAGGGYWPGRWCRSSRAGGHRWPASRPQVASRQPAQRRRGPVAGRPSDGRTNTASAGRRGGGSSDRLVPSLPKILVPRLVTGFLSMEEPQSALLTSSQIKPNAENLDGPLYYTRYISFLYPW
jgi:hypothetical protein